MTAIRSAGSNTSGGSSRQDQTQTGSGGTSMAGTEMDEFFDALSRRSAGSGEVIMQGTAAENGQPTEQSPSDEPKVASPPVPKAEAATPPTDESPFDGVVPPSPSPSPYVSEDPTDSSSDEDVEETPAVSTSREAHLAHTREDYFTRHPNPDMQHRAKSGTSSPSASDGGKGRRSRGAPNAGRGSTSKGSNATEEIPAPLSKGAWGGLVSPSLSSSSVLSSGVSIGATLGGQERIFPIRSVVAPSHGRPSMPTPTASSSSPPTNTMNRSASVNSVRSTTSSGGTAGQGPFPASSFDPPRHAGGDRSTILDSQAGDEMSSYGQYISSAAEYQRRSPAPSEVSDFSFSKPYFRRKESGFSVNTGSDPAALTYASTSRSSDDSDPTLRRSSAGTPSTSIAPRTPYGERSNPSSSRPSLSRIDSERSAQDSEKRLADDDPNVKAKKAYDAGETEEGPSKDSDHLGTLHEKMDGMYMTVRFEHQETEDGHAILTGRKGELLKCEDEPIHIPGAVQNYGVLVACEEDSDGNFVVVQVSENCGDILGFTPRLLFSLDSFTDILDEDNKEVFTEAVENLDENVNSSDEQEASPPNHVDPHSALAGGNNFQLSGRGSLGSGPAGGDSRLEWACWCAVHRPDMANRPRLLVVEFELENDLANPIMRERTQDEIDQDRRKDQSRSLFQPDSQLDEASTSGAFGRADGEVALPDDRKSSLPGTIGGGGDNTMTESSSKPARPPNSRQPSLASSTSTSSLEELEGLGDAATEDEIAASTQSRVKPIKALRRLRKSKGSGDIMKLFAMLGQVNDELGKAKDLQTSLEIAAGVVAEITGFHRVMIYQFDESWNGQVVAELVDYKQTRDLYRGLHFPASDIPAQARELYKINKVRLLYDRDQPTARLVCRSLEELNRPLDLTHSHLRAMSPIHIKYLVNMGVRASMSISIMAFGQLWGLISCHTYGRYGQRVSFPGRQLCRLLGGSISSNIERLSYAQRLQSRKLINTIPTSTNPGGYIIAKAEDLIALFDADFGVLSVGEEAKILGSLENSQEVLAVLEYLRAKQSDEVLVTQNIVTDFPDLDYPAGFQLVAGMLSVPLARGGKDFIAFFRKGQVENVHWAGNPYDKVMRSQQGKKIMLEPRKSFKIWSETVNGKCRAWSDENLETACVLRLVYGKFIEVWRQREAALTSSRLTNLLLSNASHEVRTPLNHIINYLEMALEGPLDDDTRESLVRSHSASRALVHVINDLLDLTRTESGQTVFLQEPLDLGNTIEDAVSVHRSEAMRRGLGFEIVENPSGTPQTLLGDRGKIRQIIANVTANAVKYTKEGRVTVEWGELPKQVEDAVEASQDTIKIGIAISDTGAGIPESQLEEMFRIFEEVEMEDVTKSDAGGKASGLGLGLAVVARIVAQLGGQLRVESKVGLGSKFTFVLHFRLPLAEDNVSRRGSIHSTLSTSTRRSPAKGENPNSRSGTNSTAARSNYRSAPTDSSEGGRDVPEDGSTPQGEEMLRSQAGRLGGSAGSGGQKSVRSVGSSIDNLVQTISAPPEDDEVSGNGRQPAIIPNREYKDGQVQVESSRTPLKGVKIGEFEIDPGNNNTGPSHPSASQVPPSKPSLRRHVSRRPGQGHPNPGFTQGAGGSGSATVIGPSTSAPTADNSESPRRGSATSAPLRVMIVEDDAINRAILLKKLKKDFSHEVECCIHGELAVQMFEKDRNFDVILMDLQMPICDGYTATQRIREIEEKSLTHVTRHHPAVPSEVPIFAVSASLHENQKNQLVQTGFSAFILKPVDFTRLQELMKGTSDKAAREANMYQAGRWEKGGWLERSSAPGPPTPGAQ